MLEGDERRSLLAEAVEAPGVLLLGGGADGAHGGAVGRARGEALRQVFLDRDLAADLDLSGEIGNAEAARAQQAQDAIAVDAVPDRQRVNIGVRQRSLASPGAFPGKRR